MKNPWTMIWTLAFILRDMEGIWRGLNCIDYIVTKYSLNMSSDTFLLNEYMKRLLDDWKNKHHWTAQVTTQRCTVPRITHCPYLLRREECLPTEKVISCQLLCLLSSEWRTDLGVWSRKTKMYRANNRKHATQYPFGNAVVLLPWQVMTSPMNEVVLSLKQIRCPLLGLFWDTLHVSAQKSTCPMFWDLAFHISVPSFSWALKTISFSNRMGG